MKPQQKYKAMGKNELAELLGISPSTLREWLNKLYFAEIEPLGYCKSDKLLKPNIVKYLSEKLIILL
jgi:hypothetical protein